MQVLVCLAEQQGEVVSKEQLIHTVWADTFVTDHVLTHSISELRRAFEDDAKQPRVIETVPKGGYRLIASVIRGSPQAGTEAVLQSSSFAPVPSYLRGRFFVRACSADRHLFWQLAIAAAVRTTG